MKLQPAINTSPGRVRSRQRSNGGFAVIIMLALVSIAVVYAAANTRSLNRLSRQLKALEQKQIYRLNSTTATNNIVRSLGTNAPSNPLPAAISTPE